MKIHLAYVCTSIIATASASNLTNTQGEFTVNEILTSPNQELSAFDAYFALSGYDEIKSYVDQYNEVNDGSNPTKALIMFSRIMNGGMEHPSQNIVNSTAARIGVDYMRDLDIDLDCAHLEDSDFELCGAINETAVNEEPTPYAYADDDDVMFFDQSPYQIHCSRLHSSMSYSECDKLINRLQNSSSTLPLAPRTIVNGICYVSWSEEVPGVPLGGLYDAAHEILQTCVQSHLSGRALNARLGSTIVTECISDRAEGCK